MGRRVFPIEVVHVVRGDERNSHPLGQLDRPFGALPLDLEPGVLNFEEIVLTEEIAVPGDRLLGFVQLAAEDLI